MQRVLEKQDFSTTGSRVRRGSYELRRSHSGNDAAATKAICCFSEGDAIIGPCLGSGFREIDTRELDGGRHARDMPTVDGEPTDRPDDAAIDPR
jgi:hypothetical protein